MSDNWKDRAGGSAWQTAPTDNWNDGHAATNGDGWANDNMNASNINDARDFANDNGFEATNDTTGTDSGCRNCGQEGHFARDCTEPKRLGACFNCGEEGHNKADCPKPRVFKGTCNLCSEEGHPAARCPNKPKTCGRCKEEGHTAAECKSNFYLNLEDVASVTEAVAWSKVVEASKGNEVDDFKDALRMLQKAAPELTYPAIEKRLRAQDLTFYLIALKKDIGGGHTLVNLQGEPEKTHSVAIFKSPNCSRPNMVDKWPTSTDENLERLADAGVPMEKGVPYCRTCEKFAHSTRDCDQERVPVEAPSVTCALCGETGHRVRDCKEPRKKPREPRTCKICGSEDHIAKECDQKPERPPMICRNCEKEGHKASECTEERILRCLNCDEVGHHRKECPQPMDWSKATCRYCGEKGHLSQNRCAPGAAKNKENDNNVNGTGQETNGTAGDEHVNDTSGATTGGDWENGPSAGNGVYGEWANSNTQQVGAATPW